MVSGGVEGAKKVKGLQKIGKGREKLGIREGFTSVPMAELRL